MQKLKVIGVVVLSAAVAAGLAYWTARDQGRSELAPIKIDGGSPKTATPAAGSDVEVVAEGLEIPWEVAFLPDRTMLVTERPGRLLHITADKTIIPIAGVAHVGEGGLLGVAVHPRFASNHWLYLYLTTRGGPGLINRVERYELVDNELHNRHLILGGIPGASIHDGGRLAFGPDNRLYITTGDAGQENVAQDKDSLAGKILRVNDDGTLPADNPFGNAIYSWGHRNVQGIAWDTTGRLWATEHGRSGIRSGLDELNIISPGKNYGWPTIQGDQRQAGLEPPVLHSGENDTWAPAGAAFWADTNGLLRRQGSIFFGGLRGEALYGAHLDGDTVELETHFHEQFGRIRAVTAGPDGWLYITTSNRDGRGTVRPGDDKVLRINPRMLE